MGNRRYPLLTILYTEEYPEPNHNKNIADRLISQLSYHF
jgi:hypothetical protein